MPTGSRFRSPRSGRGDDVLANVLPGPLFEEDVWSFEAEQKGFENSERTPSLDLHPAIRPCYELTIRKWQEHLARTTPT